MTETSSRARPARVDPHPEWGSAVPAVLPPLHAPPVARADLVLRDKVLARLAASTASIVSLQAPAGYGKTTVLAQWAERERRPLCWISLDASADDPVVFGSRLTAAIAGVQPSSSALHPVLSGHEVGFASVVLPTLGQQLQAASTPFVLVLDDVQLITDPAAIGILSLVVASLPAGSQLAIASRTIPPIPIARLRANGCLLEIGVRELALSRRETRVFLAGSGLGQNVADAVLAASEGWPAGVYLSGVANRPAHGPRPATIAGAGSERIVVDYLRSEMWAELDDATLQFLTRTSILTELTGPLCDAVLDSRGSGAVLSDLRGGNVLLVPLDSRDARFRFHRLLLDALRSELERRESDLIPVLHDRASRWFERHGSVDDAIRHAKLGGDLARAAELVWSNLRLVMGSGASYVARGWLDGIGAADVVRLPQLLAVAAWAALLDCDVQALDSWILIAGPMAAERDESGHGRPGNGRRGKSGSGKGGSDSDRSDRGRSERGRSDRGRSEHAGSAREPLAALQVLRALRGDFGHTGMAEAAESALRGLAADSPWRSVACFVIAIGCLLTGDRRAAQDHLRTAESLAAGLGAPLVRAECLATLGLLEFEAGHWERATALATSARESVRWNGNHGDSGDDSGSGLAFAVLAAVQARGGDVAGARRMLARARRSTMDLCAPARWFQIVTRAVQATACVPLGDVPTARLLVRDARQRNDSGEWSEFLGAIIDHAERAVVDAAADHSLGSTPLTTAELRVLRYLPTQLSFPEIAGGLFVSRHTIKTQALAVYHKLGVSSRTAAVDRARDLGLLPELPVGAT